MAVADLWPDYTPEIRELAQAVAALVRAAYPNAVEQAELKDNVARYGPGPRRSDCVIYVAAQTNHVNLGFFYGSTLSDPTGLIEGTGKRMRHVKLRTLADLQLPVLHALVAAAVAQGKL
jgi:hypothetical protein